MAGGSVLSPIVWQKIVCRFPKSRRKLCFGQSHFWHHYTVSEPRQSMVRGWLTSMASDWQSGTSVGQRGRLNRAHCWGHAESEELLRQVVNRCERLRRKSQETYHLWFQRSEGHRGLGLAAYEQGRLNDAVHFLRADASPCPVPHGEYHAPKVLVIFPSGGFVAHLSRTRWILDHV